MTSTRGKTAANKGKGAGIKFLRDHVTYQGDDCVLWPLAHPNGYGQLGHNGQLHYAHRLMCEMAHGPAPEGKIEAAHNCGNGLCVNPRHLEWKTPSANQADRATHGTKSRGRVGKISPEQAAEIRALRGTLSQEQIAARYGITRSNVSHIQCGNHHTRKTKGYQKSGRWYYARIKLNGQDVQLGRFDNPKDAHAAWRAARDRVRDSCSN